MSEPLYSCKYCKRKFFNERTFMKHTCTAMERSREIQTIVGQQAYGLYKVWLEKQRRKPPAVEGFLTSAYYSSFIKFTQWVRDTGIPDPEKFVDLMVQSKIAPALWRRGECYAIYLEYTDKRSDPDAQAQITAETLAALSEGLGVPMDQVFKQFKAPEIGELIQQRRLSPWLLFCSKSFKEWVGTLHDGERAHLMKSLGIDYWTVRFERSPDKVKFLKEYAQQLGI